MGLFRLSIYSGISFGNLCLSGHWSLSCSHQICEHRIVHTILYYPFRIYNDVSSFISDGSNSLPFFIISLAIDISILLMFSKYQLLVLLSLLISCLQVHCFLIQFLLFHFFYLICLNLLFFQVF